MGLLDYYRQFEGMPDEEVSERLRAQAEERRRLALARVEPLDLSATTWHEFPHPDVVAAITYAARRGINRSTDRYAVELRREIGRRHGLESDRIAVGNGAAQLLSAVTGALLGSGQELLTPWPSYHLFPVMARASGGRAVAVNGFSPDAILGAVSERTRVVAIANPNDPTGEHLNAGELRALIERLPGDVWVLLDEALADFVDAPDADTMALLDDHPRLLVFRTFSKIYGLAGMHCGYVLGGPGSEDLLQRIGPLLAVADIVQAGAIEALRKCGAQVERRRAAVIAERLRLAEALTGLPIEAAPSQANIVWLSPRGLTGGELAARLRRAAVIVRPGTEWGDDEHVRAALQSRPATDRLVEGLRGALGA